MSRSINVVAAITKINDLQVKISEILEKIQNAQDSAAPVKKTRSSGINSNKADKVKKLARKTKLVVEVPPLKRKRVAKEDKPAKKIVKKSKIDSSVKLKKDGTPKQKPGRKVVAEVPKKTKKVLKHKESVPAKKLKKIVKKSRAVDLDGE